MEPDFEEIFSRPSVFAFSVWSKSQRNGLGDRTVTGGPAHTRALETAGYWGCRPKQQGGARTHEKPPRLRSLTKRLPRAIKLVLRRSLPRRKRGSAFQRVGKRCRAAGFDFA